MNEPILAITVTNHTGESLRMDFQHPTASGLFVTAINGLGAPKANINMTDYAQPSNLTNRCLLIKRK